MKRRIRHDCKCSCCGYEWESRVENPKACPECKTRDWRQPTEEEARKEWEELKKQKDDVEVEKRVRTSKAEKLLKDKGLLEGGALNDKETLHNETEEAIPGT